MKSRKINPTHSISHLPLIAHLIGQSLTISRSFTSSLHWTFIFATLNHQGLSASFITLRAHVLKDKDVEKCFVFLYFRTHMLPEAASRPGLHKNSYKIS